MLNRILLIDDDDITHFICESSIKSENLAKEMISLKNGKEGIEYYRNLRDSNNAPELILLDLNMPVMNGWEFLKAFDQEFEDKFPKTKICILTSSVDPLDFSQSRNYHNVIGFISKPLIQERVQELKTNDQLAAYFDA